MYVFVDVYCYIKVIDLVYIVILFDCFGFIYDFKKIYINLLKFCF